VDIQLIETPQRFALISRETCSQGRIGETLAKILPYCYVSASAHLTENHAPICRYTRWGASDCDIEGGCLVTEKFDPPIGTKLIEMPAGRAVFAEHVGAYENLVNTHNAILAYMNANGLEFNGPPWEQYISDPGSTPADEVITHVYCPVK
jgi:AraC family transcriptional regulator